MAAMFLPQVVLQVLVSATRYHLSGSGDPDGGVSVLLMDGAPAPGDRRRAPPRALRRGYVPVIEEDLAHVVPPAESGTSPCYPAMALKETGRDILKRALLTGCTLVVLLGC